ncbi:hypothetical protein BaRGS_00022639, partial [Batillaria attramentaria]
TGSEWPHILPDDITGSGLRLGSKTVQRETSRAEGSAAASLSHYDALLAAYKGSAVRHSLHARAVSVGEVGYRETPEVGYNISERLQRFVIASLRDSR